MKQNVLFIVCLLALSLIFNSCKKSEVAHSTGGKVELFLLESYKTVGSAYSFQIDEKTVVTNAQPLLNYSDFLSYDSKKYTFVVTENARNAITGLKHSVWGVAFAIKANDVLIYTGYFWPSYSSMGCSWLVVDPIRLSMGNEMILNLGYPGLLVGQVIPDKRNDERILSILASDNKLIR